MLAALASVVVILGWLGITPQHFKVNWSMREVNVSTRKLYLVLALTSVSLVLSAVGLYFSFHPDPLHYKNKRFTETIQDRVYTNERVELDGKMYEHCTFNNVTFVFHGTGPVGFRNNVF